MRRRPLLEALGAASVSGLLAGCTAGGAGSPTGTEQPTGTATETTTATTTGTGSGGGSPTLTVDMVNTSFDPVRATVDPGTTVTWRNQDGFDHEVKAAQFTDGAAAWSFDQRVSSGETTSHTFDRPGVYEYFCPIHGKSNMCGAVLVGDVSLASGSLPCEGGGSGSGSGGSGGGGHGYS